MTLSSSLLLTTIVACGGSDFTMRSDGSSGGSSHAGGSSHSGGSHSGGSATDGGPESGVSTGGDGGGHGGASSGGATTGNGGSGNGGTTASGGTTGTAGSGNGGTTASGGTTGHGGGFTGGRTGTGGTQNRSQFAKDYNQDCKYDTECSLVYEGEDVCTCVASQCTNTAISSSALSEWNSDRQALMCPALPCSKQSCATLTASCGDQKCYARKPVIIDAKNFDQSCSSAADCTTITLGEICAPCSCSQGAVSKKGYDDYLRIKNQISCTPPPVGCGCAILPTTLTCAPSATGSGTGTCTLVSIATP